METDRFRLFKKQQPDNQQKQVEKDKLEVRVLVEKYKKFINATVDQSYEENKFLKNLNVNQIHLLINHFCEKKQLLVVANLLPTLQSIQFDSNNYGDDDTNTNFKIDSKIGIDLINAGFAGSVVKNFPLFQGLDANFVIKNMLDSTENPEQSVIFLSKYLYSFPSESISAEIMHKLVDIGFQAIVIEYYYKFESLDAYLANALVKNDQVKLIAKNIYSFKNLGPEIAEAFLNNDLVEKFSQYLDRFSGLDLETLSLYFQKSKESGIKIYPIEISKIFLETINDGASQKDLLELVSNNFDTQELGSFLYNLEDLNSDSCKIIVEKLGLDYLKNNLKIFSSVSNDVLEDLTLKLAENKGYGDAVYNLKIIKEINKLGLSSEAIEKILTEKKCYELIILGLDSVFANIDLEVLVDKMLKDDAQYILNNNIEKFLMHGLKSVFIFQKVLDSMSKNENSHQATILMSAIQFSNANNQSSQFANPETQIKFEEASTLANLLTEAKPDRTLKYDDFSVKLLEKLTTNQLGLDNIEKFIKSKAYTTSPIILENLFTTNKLDISNLEDINSLNKLYNLEDGQRKFSCAEASLFRTKYGLDFIVENSAKFEFVDELVSILLKSNPDRIITHSQFSEKLLDKMLQGALKLETIETFLKSKAYTTAPIILENLFTTNKLDISNFEDINSLNKLYNLEDGQRKFSCAEANLFISKYGLDFIVENSAKFEFVDELVSILLKHNPDRIITHSNFSEKMLYRMLRGALKFETIKAFLKSKAYLAQTEIMEKLFLGKNLDISDSKDMELLDRLYNLESQSEIQQSDIDFIIKKFGPDLAISNIEKFGDNAGNIIAEKLVSCKYPKFIFTNLEILQKYNFNVDNFFTSQSKLINNLDKYNPNSESYYQGSLPEEQTGEEKASADVVKSLNILGENLSNLPQKSLSKNLCLVLIQLGPQNVQDNLETFKDLDCEVLKMFISEGYFPSRVDLFKLNKKEAQEIIESRKSLNPLECAKINFRFGGELDPLLNTVYKVFGKFLDMQLYRDIDNLVNNDFISSTLLKIVDKTGPAGLEQLFQKFEEFKNMVISNKPLSDDQLQDFNVPVFRSYFKELVSFESSQWGSHNDGGFSTIINGYSDYINKEDRNDAVVDIIPGEVLLKAENDFSPTLDVQEKVIQLEENCKLSLQVLDPTNRLNLFKISHQIKKTISELIKRKEEELADVTKNRTEIAKQSIAKEIENLQNVASMKISEMLESITEVISVTINEKGLHDILRTILFAYTVKKHPQLRQSLEQSINSESINEEKINFMIEFVTHFTKMETWRSTFEHDKKLYKKIKSLLSIKSLTEYLKLVEKKREKPTDETLQIEMIPCRNLLTEFSGHIADACWAGKYTSVLKSMPNLTSVIITEAADKKPVGAFLLLESTNSAGEKVLVIRGINPKMEWIAKIDESSFIEKVIETSRKIASLRGAKLAIVIDNHVGGATSNRPSVYSRISDLKPKLIPVKGLDLNNTEFNGYDITSDTFYI